MRSKFLFCALGLLALGHGAALSPALAAGPQSLVTGVEVKAEDGYTRIVVTGAEPFTPTVRSLGRPSATIITVPGGYKPGKAGYARVRKNDVTTVRYGRWTSRPPMVRIVANTRGYLPYTTEGSADKKRWEIKVWKRGVKPGASAQAKSVAATRPAPVMAAPVRVASASPVVITPKPTPPQAVPAPVRVAKARPTQIAAAERRVSLDFVGADINDVLKALSLQGGVNVVTAADVKGNVTVALNRVTVPEALDMVTRLSSFQYAKIGETFIVGTPASVAALTSGGMASAAVVNEAVHFFQADGDTLIKSLNTAYPRISASLVKPGGVVTKVKTTKGTDANGNATTANESESIAPKGGIVVVTGTAGDVEAVRRFVNNTEARFGEKVEQEAQTLVAQAEQTRAAQIQARAGFVTETYRVRYTSPTDLIGILRQQVPTVEVTLGPSQGFLSGSTGASASYSNGSSAGATPSGGAGTANPAGAVASGSAPTVLLLTGPPAEIARARALLGEIDVRQPQMIFEAKVMDIGTTALSRIGLSYDFSRRVDVGELRSTGARELEFGAILRTPYSVGINLDLLAQNGTARLLANPNLSALDGQPAVVFIGDQIKYVIRQEVTPTGINIQTETATVGITLKVTGKASPDGTITLYVHPEVSVISGYLNLDGGISLPQIATRFVDTTIRVKDGETIAIGGLIRESDITNIQKVPFLGDLPFIGQLFRKTEKNRDRSEVVVFITSRILKD